MLLFIFLFIVLPYFIFQFMKSKRPKLNLKGKLVFITGGGMGLGKCMAFEFLSKGAKVVICDLKQEVLDSAIEEAKKKGWTLNGLILDVTNREKVFEAAEAIKKKFGKVDILINNAGVIVGKNFLELTQSDINLTMNVNAISHFWTIQAFLPDMIKSESGLLVTIASTASIFGVPKMSDYCASKFAAFGLLDTIRGELLKASVKNVNTLIVCPGFMKTGMFEGYSQKWWVNFVLPDLEPSDVAKKTIEAVESQETVLILPMSMRSGYLLRLLPTPVLDWVSKVTGVWNNMDNFQGRKTN